MNILANVLVVVVALLHVLFLVLEMFLWTTPTGRKIFRLTEQQAKGSEVLAKNQGLYNGFLAAGLIWSLFLNPAFADQAKLFFLGCVIVASLYGAYTSSKSILVVQGVPAMLALAAVLAAH
jgi:putative membrane protein